MPWTPQIKHTTSGKFVQDPTGAWHYHFNPKLAGGTIGQAAVDALANRPFVASVDNPKTIDPAPAWLWFNGTPTPILIDDTNASLENRFWKLRGLNMAKISALDMLERLSRGEDVFPD